MYDLKTSDLYFPVLNLLVDYPDYKLTHPRLSLGSIHYNHIMIQAPYITPSKDHLCRLGYDWHGIDLLFHIWVDTESLAYAMHPGRIAHLQPLLPRTAPTVGLCGGQ
jgi:hypothetical protein